MNHANTSANASMAEGGFLKVREVKNVATVLLASRLPVRSKKKRIVEGDEIQRKLFPTRYNTMDTKEKDTEEQGS